MPVTRPTFYVTDFVGDEIAVKAGGVLFYKKENNTYFFLMINDDGKYEDFGGCTDDCDKNINETISREVEEESNCIFKREDILKRLDSSTMYINVQSKYIYYIMEVTNKEKKLKPRDFGLREEHDNFDRTVEWVNLSKFSDQLFLKKINFRLKTRDFFSFINSLNKKEIELQNEENNNYSSSDSEKESIFDSEKTQKRVGKKIIKYKDYTPTKPQKTITKTKTITKSKPKPKQSPPSSFGDNYDIDE
jgi:hypothetical protein